MQTKVGNFVLDDGRGLLVDEAGNAVAIRPQSIKVLTVLAERQDQIVSKDDLAEAVWRGPGARAGLHSPRPSAISLPQRGIRATDAGVAQG